jgi:hypothetical protein
MPRKSLHNANASKAAKRFGRMSARQYRMRAVTKRGEKPLVPAAVLRKLADLRLPPNPWVYQVCLEALLRGP